MSVKLQFDLSNWIVGVQWMRKVYQVQCVCGSCPNPNYRTHTLGVWFHLGPAALFLFHCRQVPLLATCVSEPSRN